MDEILKERVLRKLKEVHLEIAENHYEHTKFDYYGVTDKVNAYYWELSRQLEELEELIKNL